MARLALSLQVGPCYPPQAMGAGGVAAQAYRGGGSFHTAPRLGPIAVVTLSSTDGAASEVPIPASAVTSSLAERRTEEPGDGGGGVPA